MAAMVDAKPAYRGEAKVWEALERLLPHGIVAYNNREINGREYDFCLLIEDMGVLVIEVKGWRADKITVRGVDEIVVEGYEKPQRSPKKQARAYRFALLNRIAEEYSLSPCVFDMVCYPFISAEEYRNTRLDTVSEEQFTICREDLERADALLGKIRRAYDALRYIPHDALTADLIARLRQAWEPAYERPVQEMAGTAHPYSILSVHPNEVTQAEIERMVAAYFAGTKHVVFLGDQESYARAAEAFRRAFAQCNIEPLAHGLQIGHRSGLVVGGRSFRSFHLEVYLIDRLDEITASAVSYEEGEGAERLLLERLSASSDFNDQQYLVEHAPSDRNVLVAAGAGTGKTFSMVSRVAFLCSKKADAVAHLEEEIAMVTFTNDAANNMKSRLKQMFVNYFILTNQPRYLKFVEDVDRAHISTIHRFALEILRSAPLYTGLGTNFRIGSNEYLRGKLYDAYLEDFLARAEQENPNFMHEIPVPAYELKRKLMTIADRLLTKSVLLREIKRAQMGVEVNGVLPFNDLIEQVMLPAEEAYATSMHDANEIDLMECIILLNQVLRQISGTLASLRLRYLFVDEFQDTDDVQIQTFQLLQKAMNADCRFFVVGDLKQSIYRFRGARLSAFDQLRKGSLFEWADPYYLTINYRTDHRLLDAFHAVFEGMGQTGCLPYEAKVDRLTGRVAVGMAGEELFLSVPVHAKDEEHFFRAVIDVLRQQEARIAGMMRSREEKGLPPLGRAERTIAVLVRTNWQAERLIQAAKQDGIVLHTKSGGDLYQLESTHDLYKLLLALGNSSNPLHLINFIESNYTGLRPGYHVYRGMRTEDCAADLQRILDEFFGTHMNQTWQEIVSAAYTQPILFVLRRLYEALQPWKQYSRDAEEQHYYRVNYEYLMECMIQSANVDTLTLNRLTGYLKVHIMTNQKRAARESAVDDAGIRFVCATVHKSKGLEYGAVILPYTDEDIGRVRKMQLEANYADTKLSYIVPFGNDLTEKNSNYDKDVEVEEQIAEESRMLYVALTRAIHSCVWIQNLDSKAAVSWGSLMEE